MSRIIVCATCIAALSLGCGESSTESAGGAGGSAGTGGSSGAGGTSGAGGAGGSSGMGGGGGSETVINGCTEAEAMDMSGAANVTITDVSAWVVPHSACIRVSANTAVTWEGNFTAHPLVGGVTPMVDDASPITMIDATSGTADASVTLETAGTYPYFCDIHLTSMQGVIYVE